MPPVIGLGQIIETGAAQPLVVDDEAAGLDDIHGDAEAGAEAENRTAVLRNIGLVEGKTHVGGFPGKWPIQGFAFPGNFLYIPLVGQGVRGTPRGVLPHFLQRLPRHFDA